MRRAWRGGILQAQVNYFFLCPQTTDLFLCPQQLILFYALKQLIIKSGLFSFSAVVKGRGRGATGAGRGRERQAGRVAETF